MPHPNPKYALAGPNIVHETFADEVVVVSLDSGSYYSLEGSATKCWDLALAGFPVDEIVDSLCTEYQVARPVVETSVERFMSEVCQEGLLITRSESECESDSQLLENTPKARAPIASVERDAPFPPPTLVRDDEMRHLLLIHPVHMVGDAGWPQLPPDPACNDNG
ncbi:MAG: PqqD family protein [Rhodothermia bacterium]